PQRVHAGGKARYGQRPRQEIAAVNRQPDAVSIVAIEIGMSGTERLRLAGRRVAKAVDIMVAVALGVGDADQGAERKVLLHGKPGLTGQVLARDEEFFAFRAPF